jgi:CheY-like chemotaxis protein
MKPKLLPRKQKSVLRQQTSQFSSAKRLLLIEDNDVNRLLMSEYLSYFKYEVESLARGSDFFAAINQFQPHLILLDLKLPDIDGYTLLEKVQSTPNWKKIPIIIVSAFAFATDQERALKLGASRYFVKPVNLTHLIEAIEEELAMLS